MSSDLYSFSKNPQSGDELCARQVIFWVLPCLAQVLIIPFCTSVTSMQNAGWSWPFELVEQVYRAAVMMLASCAGPDPT